MINSIEIKERIWNGRKQSEEVKYTTVTRDEYSGDFDRLILKHMDSWDIKDYAADYCEMVDEDDVEERELDDFKDYEIFHFIEEKGFKAIKCQTITDAMKFEKLKEEMAI